VDSTSDIPGSPNGDPVDVARSWVALTTRGIILISIERLAQGHDVDLVLAHETAHDFLLTGSVFGSQLEVLSAIGGPPWPEGVLRRSVRRMLNKAVAASLRTQEGCATFAPSIRIAGSALDSYWAGVPSEYHDYASDLEWLRTRPLAPEAVEQVVFGLGEFALGTRIPSWGFTDATAMARALGDPLQNPDERFKAACDALRTATDAEVLEIAQASAPAEVIAGSWYPRAGGAVAPYESKPDGGPSAPSWWRKLIAEITDVWLADPSVSRDELDLLHGAIRLEGGISLLPTPTYTMLKPLLTTTYSQHGLVIDHPPIDRLLAHRLAHVSYNPFPVLTPGIEEVGGTSLPLETDEAALWLSSPGLDPVAARLTRTEFLDYLRRVAPETTLCFFDAGYFFAEGDVLAAEPLVRDRPHAVLLRQRSLGGLLFELDALGKVANQQEAVYTVVSGNVDGVRYFTIRPSSASYPLIIAPVPGPTADRAVRLIHDGAYAGLRWCEAASPLEFFERDMSRLVHLARICATFEDQPWPPIAQSS
jgi:hypothetical protein